jgi:hypothetical protein
MSPTSSQAVLQEKLRAYFLEMAAIKADEDKNPDEVDRFVFHMMEFLEGVRRYVELIEQPERFTPEDFKQVINALLYHDLPHLIAAARKYDYVPDFLD